MSSFLELCNRRDFANLNVLYTMQLVITFIDQHLFTTVVIYIGWCINAGQ